MVHSVLKGVSLEILSLAGYVCKPSLLKTKGELCQEKAKLLLSLVSGWHICVLRGRMSTRMVSKQPFHLPAASWLWGKAAVQEVSALICVFSSLRPSLRI